MDEYNGTKNVVMDKRTNKSILKELKCSPKATLHMLAANSLQIYHVIDLELIDAEKVE